MAIGQGREEMRCARDQRVLVARPVPFDGERDQKAGGFEAGIVATERCKPGGGSRLVLSRTVGAASRVRVRSRCRSAISLSARALPSSSIRAASSSSISRRRAASASDGSAAHSARRASSPNPSDCSISAGRETLELGAAAAACRDPVRRRGEIAGIAHAGERRQGLPFALQSDPFAFDGIETGGEPFALLGDLPRRRFGRACLAEAVAQRRDGGNVVRRDEVESDAPHERAYFGAAQLEGLRHLVGALARRRPLRPGRRHVRTIRRAPPRLLLRPHRAAVRSPAWPAAKRLANSRTRGSAPVRLRRCRRARCAPFRCRAPHRADPASARRARRDGGFDLAHGERECLAANAHVEFIAERPRVPGRNASSRLASASNFATSASNASRSLIRPMTAPSQFAISDGAPGTTPAALHKACHAASCAARRIARSASAASRGLLFRVGLFEPPRDLGHAAPDGRSRRRAGRQYGRPPGWSVRRLARARCGSSGRDREDRREVRTAALRPTGGRVRRVRQTLPPPSGVPAAAPRPARACSSLAISCSNALRRAARSLACFSSSESSLPQRRTISAEGNARSMRRSNGTGGISRATRWASTLRRRSSVADSSGRPATASASGRSATSRRRSGSGSRVASAAFFFISAAARVGGGRHLVACEASPSPI